MGVVPRSVLVASAGTIAAAAGLAIVLGVSLAKEQAVGPRDPAHEVPTQVRTVLLSAAMPAPSELGLLVRAQLREGPMPSRGMPAVVLADEDCVPDSTGISHCRNVLRLESGGTVVVRHPHDMREVPCLTPGERVVVQRAA